MFYYYMKLLSSPYIRADEEQKLVSHQGIFRSRVSLFETIAIVVSGTIGAGVLGIPFAISKVGIGIGLVLIALVGLLMMGVNLLVGDIAMKAGKPFQLPGLAGHYLGPVGKFLMTLILYSSIFGVLLVYIIGEGEALSALFGGSQFYWSVSFFALGAVLIFFGIQTIKVIELFLTLGVLVIVLGIAAASVRHIEPSFLTHFNTANLFLPYGVLVFAFHGTASIPEAYSVADKRDSVFKRAIVIAGITVAIAYSLFSFVVVGVTGGNTTEIATIGLGRAVGPLAFTLGNLFAALAMGTSFLMAGLALRDSFSLDFNVPRRIAFVIVCGVPFLLFMLGLRGFIETMNLIGGALMSAEILLILLMWILARGTQTPK